MLDMREWMCLEFFVAGADDCLAAGCTAHAKSKNPVEPYAGPERQCLGQASQLFRKLRLRAGRLRDQLSALSIIIGDGSGPWLCACFADRTSHLELRHQT